MPEWVRRPVDPLNETERDRMYDARDQLRAAMGKSVVASFVTGEFVASLEYLISLRMNFREAAYQVNEAADLMQTNLTGEEAEELLSAPTIMERLADEVVMDALALGVAE
jgi:hypothetical protein